MAGRVTVSVVIPVFNKAAYLRRALESVRVQTFEDVEVLVVDDGSTDESLSFAKAWHDPRVRVIAQENAGPGAARNRGLAESRGEFTAFLDADDAWMPDFLTAGLKRIQHDPAGASCVTSGYIEMPAAHSTEKLWRSRGLSNGTIRVRSDTNPALAVSLVAYMTPCTTMARTDILRRWGGFYSAERCLYGEDAHLWLKIVMNEPIIVDLRPRTLIFRDASSLSGNLPGARPVEPFLRDPSEVEAACPSSLRPLLNRMLAIRAFKTSCVLAYWGNWREAAMLRRRFAPNDLAPLPYRLTSRLCATPVGAAIGLSWRRVNRWRLTSNQHATE